MYKIRIQQLNTKYIPPEIVLPIQQVGFNCDIFHSLRATRKSIADNSLCTSSSYLHISVTGVSFTFFNPLPLRK